MTSGTTYSRTSGTAILPQTWETIRSRHPGQALKPHERTSWDEKSAADREQFLQLALQDRTRPPDFLAFNLANDPYGPGQYPAAVPEEKGFPATGHLGLGQSHSTVATQLGITERQLSEALSNFSGQVSVIKLLAGSKIYRTVGLTANYIGHGAVTNQILGPYWEPRCPSEYASIDSWRQAMAVLAEWNGDYGYIEVTLDNDLVLLSGQTGMKVVDAVNRDVLPGGGQQYFVPGIAQQLPGLASRIATEPLATLIQPTRFGSLAP